MASRFLFLSAALFLGACTSSAQGDPASFGQYWHQNKAEISSYQLEQARYGELRKGEAVMIFVTEDFSKSKQVKLDNPSKNPSDAVKVLKLNALRDFNTGLYSYHTMQSVFTPVERDRHPHTFKVTTSVQDWCGQAFAQMNLQIYKYRFQQHSYFEKEADHELILDKATLEEELFNLIRISPKLLPVGEVEIIPNALTARFLHTEPAVEEATAKLAPHASNPEWQTYTVDFKRAKRQLSIHFLGRFPFDIQGWEETYTENGQQLTTRATKKAQILVDYWNKNHLADENLRQQLLLNK